jgi:predicted CoA-binding protein
MAVGDRTQLGGTAYDRLRILTTCRTIAMVGLSANPYHPSDFAAIYLAANGYNIIPINPSQAGKTILGERVYARVDEIGRPVDECLSPFCRGAGHRPTSGEDQS